jgi:hypothetical protein
LISASSFSDSGRLDDGMVQHTNTPVPVCCRMKSHGTSARRSGGSGVCERPISHCFIGLISFSYPAPRAISRPY